MKDLKLKQPIVCLAPMDGVTDQSFRLIVRKLNADVILYSEFTNVHRVLDGNKINPRLIFEDRELPYFVQLFGHEPHLFAESARYLEDIGVSGIDINMGCPSKRIVHSQHGSGLMKQTDLACRIIEACSNAVKIPITVKSRLGWKDHLNLVPFVNSLVDAGLKMICIHGRTYTHAFKGEANWDPIYELKKKVSIPVIGNGDVSSKFDGEIKLRNLDGYMIGRAAIGNPWIFLSNEEQQEVKFGDKISVMLEHLQLSLRSKNEPLALLTFRKYLPTYLSGIQEAKKIRKFLMESKTEKEFSIRALSLSNS